MEDSDQIFYANEDYYCIMTCLSVHSSETDDCAAKAT